MVGWSSTSSGLRRRRPITATRLIKGSYNGVTLEVVFMHTDVDDSEIVSFVNTIPP